MPTSQASPEIFESGFLPLSFASPSLLLILQTHRKIFCSPSTTVCTCLGRILYSVSIPLLSLVHWKVCLLLSVLASSAVFSSLFCNYSFTCFYFPPLGWEFLEYGISLLGLLCCDFTQIYNALTASTEMPQNSSSEKHLFKRWAFPVQIDLFAMFIFFNLQTHKLVCISFLVQLETFYSCNCL